MAQNNTWKHYLTTGLITISLFTLLNSCTEETQNILGEYRFVNETSYNITYDQPSLEKFNVPANSTTVVLQRLRTDGKNKAMLLNFPSLLYFYTGINIKFNNIKCLNVKENDINSIRDIKNFVAEKINNDNYRFTYTFTEADYNRAITCP